MKCRIEIKRQKLEHFKTDTLWGTLKRSASEHGYFGFWGILYFTLWAGIDNLILTMALYFPLPPSIRIFIHRTRGVKIGHNSMIGLNVMLDNVFPNFITIGNNVSLAGQNNILCHSTPYQHFTPFFESYVAPVIIEDNAWIAIGAIILPGITIGKGSVVSAGAVVTSDVAPYTVVGGVPAKLLKNIQLKNAE